MAEFWTARETADYLGLTWSHVKRYAKQIGGKKDRKTGEWRFDPETVRAYERERMQRWPFNVSDEEFARLWPITPNEEMAARWDTTVDALRRRAKRLGLPSKPKASSLNRERAWNRGKFLLTPEQIEEAYRRADAHEPVPAIAASFGVAPINVYRHLWRRGEREGLTTRSG